MLLSDPVLQKLNGRPVTEGRMQPLPVVENLNVFESHRLDVDVSGIANAMHPLVLEAVEPDLRRCIVPAVSLATHRADHAIRLELVLEGMAGVLASPVGVVQPRIGAGFLRNQAMVSAPITMSAVRRGFNDQPTTSRLNKSSAMAR